MLLKETNTENIANTYRLDLTTS